MAEIGAETQKAPRILLVEDQMIIAMELQDTLQDLGCEVVGPVGALERAVDLARAERLDAAILDVNIDGSKVFPVAEELQARRIPFVFATGYGEASLPEKWRDAFRLTKPLQRKRLELFIKKISDK